MTYQLLTRPDSQPKAVKGEKKGYMTFVLHLAPSDVSGFNVCPNAGGCKIACVHKAGRGGFDPRVEVARIRKTRWYFTDRASFMAALHDDIAKAIAYAGRKGFIAAFRLNGTSDIPWHRMGVMEAFPLVQGRRSAITAALSAIEGGEMSGWLLVLLAALVASLLFMLYRDASGP